jgi:hypothetical protein
MEVKDLMRGDIVMALRHLDPNGADVRKGTIGVVFEETNYYSDGAGPMVRFMNCGACNVYRGDVVVISSKLTKYEIIDAETGEILGQI